mmetsp:Transcript_26267/g.51192  ORF Transcript_26267/g.51192 Transcript_26267/m.51192 type:complete len:209 (+) Transcript_26267:67-693(+)|eukprot:CAMPEP_0173391102 /NCGR_PEP_ID=MMETSP1356-20130122/17325_1 /TAXON_ID=77927 ORGANISM="Hemiselmis virescens, Strain PCC157" /NCGR_SAMPLE_ID=MMETSP1356 /ASSEMBLY_ACC=CAM_ASM_000847 /LENGTH=208 /DNA_ID=CAMNT_0014348645 /DNA_START=61 /DNA_END=687 /DNA_ORIENTATION=+
MTMAWESNAAWAGSEKQVLQLVEGKMYMAVHSGEVETRNIISAYPYLFFFSNNIPETTDILKTLDQGAVTDILAFCKDVNSKRHDNRIAGRPLIFYVYGESQQDQCVVASAVLLMGAYLVIEDGLSPAKAAAKLNELEFKLVWSSSQGLEGYLAAVESAVKAVDNAEVDSPQQKPEEMLWTIRENSVLTGEDMTACDQGVGLVAQQVM